MPATKVIVLEKTRRLEEALAGAAADLPVRLRAVRSWDEVERERADTFAPVLIVEDDGGEENAQQLFSHQRENALVVVITPLKLFAALHFRAAGVLEVLADIRSGSALSPWLLRYVEESQRQLRLAGGAEVSPRE